MKKKVIAFGSILTLLLGLSSPNLLSTTLLGTGGAIKVLAVASQDTVNQSKQLLGEALREKTFYKYNVAYASINKIDNQGVKDQLMGQLATIADIVWTSDVKKFNSLLDDLVLTKGSGKIYDVIEAQIGNSSLIAIDQGYLLTELNSWGKNIVYTSDYGNAVKKVVYAWEMLIKGTDQNITSAISEAEKAINGVSNSYSKSYLTEQIKEVKDKTEFTIVDIK